MGFGWLGTFRQGQWRNFRRVVLNERRDIDRRKTVILAEIARIGEVTVQYGMTDSGVMTEERIGFSVNPHTSLGKLIQAYAAQGGNPFDISLFLNPDSVVVLNISDDTEEFETRNSQPYGGVVYVQADAQGVNSFTDKSGQLVIKKYWPARAGGKKELQDEAPRQAVGLARKWVNQTLATRFHDLEARIIKLCDLKEQLHHEIELLELTAGGTVGAVPTLTDDLFTTDNGLSKIVTAIDNAFYQTGDNGLPDITQVRMDVALAGGLVNPDYTSLFLDFDEEANTAL